MNRLIKIKNNLSGIKKLNNKVINQLLAKTTLFVSLNNGFLNLNFSKQISKLFQNINTIFPIKLRTSNKEFY